MSDEKLERRVKIAEAALWILADRYIAEGCFDRDDKTPTDVVREARWQAEINMQPYADALLAELERTKGGMK